MNVHSTMANLYYLLSVFLFPQAAFPQSTAGPNVLGPEKWGPVRMTPERAPATDFAISPNGTELAFFGNTRFYHVYDVATGQTVRTVPTEESVHDLTFSPDGKVIATAEWSRGLKRREARTGTVIDTLTATDSLGVFYARYLPDGKLAAYCWRADAGQGTRMKEQLALWDPSGKELIGWPVTSRVESEGKFVRPRFAGNHLLSMEWQSKDGYVISRSATLTDPIKHVTSPVVRLDADDDFVFDASPDGSTLLVFNLNRPPRLIDVKTNQTRLMLHAGHQQYVSCGAFSPDGKYVATASGTRRRTNLAPGLAPPANAPTDIIIWDAATGNKVAVYRDPTTNLDFSKIAFSPDGTYLVAMSSENQSSRDYKGGRVVLWGKFPGANSTPVSTAATDDVRRLRVVLEKQQAEINRLRSEVTQLRAMVALGTATPASPVPATGRFVDHGDYVEDTKTGLLWQKDGTASGQLNFYEAAKYAMNLELGGKPGWRVPTKDEIAGIFPATESPFTNSKYNPEPYTASRPGEWANYWTSSVDPRVKDYAYIYHWYAKGGANNCIASANRGYVRCVHDPIKK